MTTVAVIGLGKIGLPLAAQFAARNLRVIGCDVDPRVVEAVNSGHSPIQREPGLEEGIAAAVSQGRLRATADGAEAAREADVAVVIVPLVVGPDKAPDFGPLDAATAAVGSGLHRGMLVLYETTVPVGTTRCRFGPMLEKFSGLRAGDDFHLAFSPERLYAGRVFDDIHRYPKVVGGIDATSTARAEDFYRAAFGADVLVVENAETAEFSKLAETTYRDVNIALANELALYGSRRNADVRQAFHAANSQPYSHLHSPSIGVGGHCIPVYPYFLLDDVKNGELSLVRDGRRTNDLMAEVGVGQLEASLGGLRGRRVLVLGAAYREDVKELAFSTVFPLVDLLHRAGARVLVHDPLYRPEELNAVEAEVVEDVDAVALEGVDAVIVQAWHRELHGVAWSRFRGLKVVLDGRGMVDAEAVRRAGASYIAIGVTETRAGTQK